jgi:hypothetical protein
LIGPTVNIDLFVEKHICEYQAGLVPERDTFVMFLRLLMPGNMFSIVLGARVMSFLGYKLCVFCLAFLMCVGGFTGFACL